MDALGSSAQWVLCITPSTGTTSGPAFVITRRLCLGGNQRNGAETFPSCAYHPHTFLKLFGAAVLSFVPNCDELLNFDTLNLTCRPHFA